MRKNLPRFRPSREWKSGVRRFKNKRGIKKPFHSRESQESPKSKTSPFPPPLSIPAPPFPFPRKRESPDSSAIGANYKPNRRERCSPRLSQQGDSRFRGNGRGESAGIKWKCANEESATSPSHQNKTPSPFPRKRESPDSSATGANYNPKRRERCSPRLNKQGDSRFRGNGRGESAGIKWKCANEESAAIPKPPNQKPSPFPPPFPFPRKRESPDSCAIGANYKPKRRERCPPRLSKQGDSRLRGNGGRGGNGRGSVFRRRV